MGMIKNYLNNVVCACSEESFGQDAVQHAIDMGYIVLTGNFDNDVRKIMAEYDALCEEYQKELNSEMAQMEEIGQPVSFFDTCEEAA